jgi:hypothetical protein
MGDVGFAELASLQQGMNDHQKMLFLTQYNAGKKDRGTALLLGFLFGVLRRQAPTASMSATRRWAFSSC